MGSLSPPLSLPSGANPPIFIRPQPPRSFFFAIRRLVLYEIEPSTLSSPSHSKNKHFYHFSRFRRLLDLQRRRRQRRRRQQQQQAPLQDQLLPVAAGGARAGVPLLPLPRRVHEGGHGDQAGSQGGKSGGESDFMKSQLLFPPQSVGDQGQNNNLSIRCTAFKTAMYAHENCRQQKNPTLPSPHFAPSEGSGDDVEIITIIILSSSSRLLCWRACVLRIWGRGRRRA